MVELKDFIVASLREIVDGVTEAREELKATGAKVAPVMSGIKTDGDKIFGFTGLGSGQRIVHAIEFDVLVEVSAEKGREGRIGVIAGAFGFGGSINANVSDSKHSRVRFSVPLALPNEAPAKEPQAC